MAVYFPAAKSLFVHFPKTGGTWVEQASCKAKIAVQRLPERTTRSMHKHLTRSHYDCPATFAWTVVRRPDEWYVSWFRYATSLLWPQYADLAGHPQSCLADCQAETFGEFVRRCIELHPGYLSEMYTLYTDGLDFVGTTENLSADMRCVLQSRIDVPELDPTPVHATDGHRPDWPAGLRQRLLDTEQGAVRIWQAAYLASEHRSEQGQRAA